MTEWMLLVTEGDVFDALRENRRIRVEADVRELALIAQACDEYCVDERAAGEAAEKLVAGGGDGTALIGEFLALELAGLLSVSPATAALRIRETLELRDRHPELWAFVMTGAVEPWRAHKVVARCSTAGLSAQAARWVDHQLAVALGAMPWGRVQRCLEGLIVAADPALAAQRAQHLHAERRVVIGDHAEGASTLFARLDTEDALALQATISRIADSLAAAGVCEPDEQRRATALGVLADPAAALALLQGTGDGRPTNRVASVVLHLSADALGTGTGVVRVDGVGPLDSVTLRRFLGCTRVLVRPVMDLNTVPALDAYEAPHRLREAVNHSAPVDVFPFGTQAANRSDLDHTVPYDRNAPPGAGQTRLDNLGPLSRRAHRAKTSRRWHLEQTEPGLFRWTSPLGFRYAVTAEGTIALGRAA